MIKNLLFICLTFFKVYLPAQNFVATYGFQDVANTSGTIDPTNTPTVTGLTFHPFTASGTSPNPSASGRFSFTDWPQGGLNGTDDYWNFTGVLSPTVFYEISISVDPGYTLSINSVSFAVRRSGTGIRNYCVRSDLDQYANNLSVSTGTNSKLSVLPGDVLFWNYDSVSTANDQKGSIVHTGSSFAALTTTVTFRFYAWNAESAGGSFSIDNVTFSGSATNTISVPNPVGFSEEVKNSEMVFYPNPSSTGKLFFENPEAFSTWEVISGAGILLCVKEVVPGKYGEIDLSEFENGIYFLRTASENKTFVKKIILSHK